MITRRSLLVAGAASAAMLGRAGAAEVGDLKWDGLYASGSFSEQAKLFNGMDVTLAGYMAPPLKADARFFVLAAIPMAICPFCAASVQWPDNIILVYVDRPINVVEFDVPIKVTGKLDLGEKTDADTGFVSMVRLVDSTYRRMPNVNVNRGKPSVFFGM